MISRAQARGLKAEVAKVGPLREKLDTEIRESILRGHHKAVVEVSSESVGNLLASELQPEGWTTDVYWVDGPDPDGDEVGHWELSVDLDDL